MSPLGQTSKRDGRQRLVTDKDLIIWVSLPNKGRDNYEIINLTGGDLGFERGGACCFRPTV